MELLFAVRNGHLDAATLLIDLGAQPNDRVENATPTQDRYGPKQNAADATTSDTSP